MVTCYLFFIPKLRLLNGNSEVGFHLANVFQQMCAILRRRLCRNNHAVLFSGHDCRRRNGAEFARLVEGDVYGVNPGACARIGIFEKQTGFGGMEVVGFNFKPHTAHVKDGAGIDGEVDFACYVIYDFGYHAVGFLNTVELNLDMFGEVFLQFVRESEASLRRNAVGEMGFRTVVFAGNSHLEIEDGVLILNPSATRQVINFMPSVIPSSITCYAVAEMTELRQRRILACVGMTGHNNLK